MQVKFSHLEIKEFKKSKTSSAKRDVKEKVYSPTVKYDTEKLRVSIARFFIRCKLPFRLVEYKKFINYVVDLEYIFTLSSQITLKIDCIK